MVVAIAVGGVLGPSLGAATDAEAYGGSNPYLSTPTPAEWAAIKEHLAKGGAMKDAPQCGAVCSTLRMEEHRTMPNQQSSRALRLSLLRARMRGGWFPPITRVFAATGKISPHAKALTAGITIGSAAHRHLLKFGLPTPGPTCSQATCTHSLERAVADTSTLPRTINIPGLSLYEGGPAVKVELEDWQNGAWVWAWRQGSGARKYNRSAPPYEGLDRYGMPYNCGAFQPGAMLGGVRPVDGVATACGPGGYGEAEGGWNNDLDIPEDFGKPTPLAPGEGVPSDMADLGTDPGMVNPPPSSADPALDQLLRDPNAAQFFHHFLRPDELVDGQPVPDPRGDPPRTVPDCDGVSYETCVERLSGAGFRSFQREYADFGTADITKAAGAVLTTNPAAGSQAQPDDLVRIRTNPTGNEMPIVVPAVAPAPGEGAEIYVDRLRELGGDADIAVRKEADPAFGAGAAVSVSPPPGTRIRPDEVVQVTANKTAARPNNGECDRGPKTDPGGGDRFRIERTSSVSIHAPLFGSPSGSISILANLTPTAGACATSNPSTVGTTTPTSRTHSGPSTTLPPSRRLPTRSSSTSSTCRTGCRAPGER